MPQMTVWLMRIACWLTKATDTHTEYVILIAFPRQQWLYERDLLLGYMYIACLVLDAQLLTINILPYTYDLLYILTLRRLMSYIYGAPILDVSRSHTTKQHSR